MQPNKFYELLSSLLQYSFDNLSNAQKDFMPHLMLLQFSKKCFVLFEKCSTLYTESRKCLLHNKYN